MVKCAAAGFWLADASPASSTHFSAAASVQMSTEERPRRTSRSFHQRAYSSTRSARSGPSAARAPSSSRFTSPSGRAMAAHAIDSMRFLGGDRAYDSAVNSSRQEDAMSAADTSAGGAPWEDGLSA